jgi:hypothetical protein
MVTFNTDASIDFSSAVGTWRSEKKVHSLELLGSIEDIDGLNLHYTE